MISLPDKIKNDLSGNLTTAQYLVAIKTDPVIYISTTKQMFSASESDPAYFGNLISMREEDWILTDDWSYENGSLRILFAGQTSGDARNPNAPILDDEKYKVSFDISEVDTGENGVGKARLLLYGSAKHGGEYDDSINIISSPSGNKFITANGHYEFYITINESGGSFDESVFVQTITDPISFKISNIKVQGLGIQPVYYEDLDLKVSNIREKIDLKTKKIQLSSMSLSFSNFPVNDVRLSDRMGSGLGREISIYLKTASCESIEDCVKVADLKINRYSHDRDTVKINADDKWLESFYVDLPKTLLEKDVNTFEAYNLKPVPILYGHLENAPALPYYSPSETYSFLSDGVTLLPDSSHLSGDGEIQGVKQWNKYDNVGILREFDEMEDPNVLKIKLGDSLLASIPVKPYINTIDSIKNIHTYSQYTTYSDHIRLDIPSSDANAIYSEGVLDVSLAGLWCSQLSKLISKNVSVYTITANYGNYINHDYVDVGEMIMRNIETGSESPRLSHNVGILDFKFNQLSGIDVYENEVGDEIPSDVHFLGSGYVKYIDYSGLQTNQGFDNLKIYTSYSPYYYDEYVTDFTNATDNIATPPAWHFFGIHTDDIDKLESVFRNKFKINGMNYSTAFPYINYLSHFNSRFEGSEQSNGYNTYKSKYYDEEKYPVLNSNTISMYFTLVDGALNDFITSPQHSVELESDWDNVKLRKYWKNKDIFEKDFFVNAKGRVGDVVLNAYAVEGEIKVFYEGSESPSDFTSHENKHLIELYKLLTDSKYKYVNINGDVYELMIRHNVGSRDHYLYDIDVNNFSAKTDINEDFNTYFTADGDVVQNLYGWIFEITAKNFGGSHLPNESSWTGQDISFFGGFNLVYGKINYTNNTIDTIIPQEHENLSGFNTSNNFQNVNASGKSYVKIIHTLNDVVNTSVPPKLLESPEEIIQNLVDTEMNAGATIMPEEETNMKFAFSINEQENSKDIIENICSQSNLFFRYSPRNGQPIIDTIKRSYSLADVDKTIITDRILKYSFGKTKIDDLCFGGCTVKWGYDYGKEELGKITEPEVLDSNVQILVEKIEDYRNEYGVEDAEKYKLEIEAPYINDEATAIKLRNFMFQFYKNTHLTIKATLPIQDAIMLEVGDIVNFDKNIGGLKPYGRSMINIETIIDQDIYPYFIITSISKTLDKVDLEVMQLHNLMGTPAADENDDDVVDDEVIDDDVNDDIVDDDTIQPLRIESINTYFTNSETNMSQDLLIYGQTNVYIEALVSGNPTNYEWSYLAITPSGTPSIGEVSLLDIDQAVGIANATNLNYLNLLSLMFGDLLGYSFIFTLEVTDDDGQSSTANSVLFSVLSPDTITENNGDVNLDGVFNVQDIQATINYILGNSELSLLQQQRADVGGDGIVDMLDIVQMVIMILGENND